MPPAVGRIAARIYCLHTDRFRFGDDPVIYWLQNKYGLGMWIIVVCGILGTLITISTVRANLRSLRKAAEEAAPQDKPPMAFNDHN